MTLQVDFTDRILLILARCTAIVYTSTHICIRWDLIDKKKSISVDPQYHDTRYLDLDPSRNTDFL
eukprot:SAG11_NODE_18190_length_497_cov_1.954774_1_plen_64_part_01